MIIAIDGIDGCGKSTLSLRLKDYFEQRGMDVVILDNPGGTTFGQHLREGLKGEHLKQHDSVDILAFAAVRMDILAKANELSKEGKLVIVNRWDLSAWAYQGFLRGQISETSALYNGLLLNMEEKWHLDIPDLMVWLYVPWAITEKRIRDRGEDGGKYERYNESWFYKLRNGYRFGYDNMLRGAKRKAIIEQFRNTNEHEEATLNQFIRLIGQSWEEKYGHPIEDNFRKPTEENPLSVDSQQ